MWSCSALAAGRRWWISPGFSSFETEELNLELKRRLPETFREFRPYLGQCRFHGCSHTKEKGCAVLEALRAGAIQPSRHKSYLRLDEELQDAPAGVAGKTRQTADDITIEEEEPCLRC